MAMSVGMLDHYNVSTRKLKETVQFYEDVLGMKNGPRPPFNFPGAWLYSGGHPVLHINDISGTDKEQRPDSGVIDHVAFGSRGFEATRKHLAGKGVDAPRQPGAELAALADFPARSEQCGDRAEFRNQGRDGGLSPGAVRCNSEGEGMSDEDMKAELERLRNENAALKKGAAAGLRMKVSEKGALSIYGMGRFP